MTYSLKAGFVALTLVFASHVVQAQEISDAPARSGSHKAAAELAGGGVAAGAAVALAELSRGGSTPAAVSNANAVQPTPAQPKLVSPSKAPEISTSGLPAGLALLAGFACILKGRRSAEV